MASENKLISFDACGMAIGGMVGGGIFAVLAIVVQSFGNLEQMTTFSSLVFLFVFAVVKFMGYKHRIFKGWKSMLPVLGSLGCTSAMIVLLVETYRSNPQTVYIVGGISVAVIISCEAYIWTHPNYKGKQN